MRCLDKFNEKMKRSGSSLREENIKNSKELIKETFFDDASLSVGSYLWEPGLRSYEKRDTLPIRIYDRTYSSANGVVVSFQTLYDFPIDVGDIVFDSLNEQYLLCTESFDINGIHWQGKLNLCNWILKWQNKNGDILEYPCCDINATQYNSGEESNRLFTVGSSQHMLTLPCDENTVVLKSPQRFFLDKDPEHPTSYIVTQNDTTNNNYGKKGLVRVTVAEYPNNVDTDNIELGICDYICKSDIALDNAENRFVSKSVISFSTTTIKSGGDMQVFTGRFFDNLGNEILDITPHWDIICDFLDVLHVQEIDHDIIIGIDNDDYVDEEFKIILSDGEGKNVSSVIVNVESLL